MKNVKKCTCNKNMFLWNITSINFIIKFTKQKGKLKDDENGQITHHPFCNQYKFLMTPNF